MGRKRQDKGRAAHPSVFIGGVPAAEHQRQQALSRRALLPADIPTEPWRADHEHYLLRSDGAILAEGCAAPLGFVQADGSVLWARMGRGTVALHDAQTI